MNHRQNHTSNEVIFGNNRHKYNIFQVFPERLKERMSSPVVFIAKQGMAKLTRADHRYIVTGSWVRLRIFCTACQFVAKCHKSPFVCQKFLQS